MIKEVVRSKYFKTAVTFIIAGLLLITVNSWISRVRISHYISIINDTLMPVYIGIFIAFLLCPIYNYIVKHVYAKIKGNDKTIGIIIQNTSFGTAIPANKTKKENCKRKLIVARIVASAVCLLALFTVAFLVGYFVVPKMFESVIELVTTMPERTKELSTWAADTFSKYPVIVKKINGIANTGSTEIIIWIQENILKKKTAAVATEISGTLIGIIGRFIDVFVGILIALYILNYKEKLFAIGNKLITAIFSYKRNESIKEFFSIINETFIGFIVGRILDAAIIGVLTYFVLWIFHIPLAPLVSVIVGITNVIPFFGPFIGAIPSFALIFLEDHQAALYFVIIIFLIQQLDGNVIGPKIVGGAIGIDSFWVLVAVLVGGGLFGFFGMALGVPVFAVIYRYINKISVYNLEKKGRNTSTDSYLDYSAFDIKREDIFHEGNNKRK